MITGMAPRWLKWLERRIGWLAIPQIAVILVTLQGLGFLMLLQSPEWAERLALIPQAVFAGEYWRLITFLALPLAASPLWLIFVLWFLYFIVNSLEDEWGAFPTTLYVLISVLVTIAVSLATGFPVVDARAFETSLFLAAAVLFPEMEIRLFFAIPVKLKWLGWLAGASVLLDFVRAGWWERLYFLAVYSNFLVFFGPGARKTVSNAIRRWRYKRKLR